MKLLAMEACQAAAYFRSRYEQVEALGADLFVLNGLGDADYWPAGRYRLAGSKHVDDLVEAASAWHEVERFDGVLTFAESAVVAAAAVADALGLPGVGVEAARASRNKLLMREAHERGGVPRPRFRLVPDLHAALATAEEFGYPVVLKPTLGSGSNFVFRLDGPDDLRRRFPQALEGMDRIPWVQREADGIDLGPHGLLLESFLDGREVLIEALAWDGEVYLGSIVDRVTVEGDTFDDDVHRAPTTLDADEIAAVRRAVAAAADAQGIRRSVLHAEVRFHEGAPHLLEIAVRPGGGGLDHFARISAGYCPIRATMDVARGVRPDVGDYRPTGVHTAGTCLISGPGVVERVDVPASVATSERVFFLKVTVQPGDVIRRPPDGNTILGFLCTTGSSFDDAMRAAYELAERIEVRLQAPGATAEAGTADRVLLSAVPRAACGPG